MLEFAFSDKFYFVWLCLVGVLGLMGFFFLGWGIGGWSTGWHWGLEASREMPVLVYPNFY